MHKGRLEAFSDGVLAIIITIMVLELKVPRDAPTFADLKPLLPTALCYLLSFAYVGIYWNNHHHMFQITHKISGAVLWANLHLLFWLSLIPFATVWLGENHFASAPTALYGVILLMAAVAYTILQITILHVPGGNPELAHAVGKDRKGKISSAFYVVAIAVSYPAPWLSSLLYVAVALIWFIPDPRIERTLPASVDSESTPPK